MFWLIPCLTLYILFISIFLIYNVSECMTFHSKIFVFGSMSLSVIASAKREKQYNKFDA